MNGLHEDRTTPVVSDARLRLYQFTISSDLRRRQPLVMLQQSAQPFATDDFAVASSLPQARQRHVPQPLVRPLLVAMATVGHLFAGQNSLCLLTCGPAIPRTVGLARDTEKDSEFLSRSANNSYENDPKEYGYEESWFSGSFFTHLANQRRLS